MNRMSEIQTKQHEKEMCNSGIWFFLRIITLKYTTNWKLIYN